MARARKLCSHIYIRADLWKRFSSEWGKAGRKKYIQCSPLSPVLLLPVPPSTFRSPLVRNSTPNFLSLPFSLLLFLLSVLKRIALIFWCEIYMPLRCVPRWYLYGMWNGAGRNCHKASSHLTRPCYVAKLHAFCSLCARYPHMCVCRRCKAQQPASAHDPEPLPWGVHA